jgi:hypothetical protein
VLPTSRVHVIPAGKAPQRGADAVKASYTPLGVACFSAAADRWPLVNLMESCRQDDQRYFHSIL